MLLVNRLDWLRMSITKCVFVSGRRDLFDKLLNASGRDLFDKLLNASEYSHTHKLRMFSFETKLKIPLFAYVKYL